MRVQLVMCTKQAEFWTSAIPVLGCHSHFHIYIGRTYSYAHSAWWCPCPGCGSAMPCSEWLDPAGTSWNWLELAVSSWDRPGHGSAVSCGGQLDLVGFSWNWLCLPGTAPASRPWPAAAAGACNGCSSWCWGVCLVQIAGCVLGGLPTCGMTKGTRMGGANQVNRYWDTAGGWITKPFGL